MIKGQILSKKTTFHLVKFFWEKRDGHSKRERVKMIDLYLNRVFADDITKNRHQFLK